MLGRKRWPSEALPLLRERADTWSAPLLILGDTALAQERFDQASRYYQEAIARFQAAPRYVAVGKRGDLSDAQAGLAGVTYCTGNLVLAARQYRASLDWRVGARLPDACGERAPRAGGGRGHIRAGRRRGAATRRGGRDRRDPRRNPLFPRDQPIRERCLAALTTLLGDDRLAAAREAGRTLRVEQAVAAAMAVAAAVAGSAFAEHD